MTASRIHRDRRAMVNETFHHWSKVRRLIARRIYRALRHQESRTAARINTMAIMSPRVAMWRLPRWGK